MNCTKYCLNSVNYFLQNSILGRNVYNVNYCNPEITLNLSLKFCFN